LPIQDLPIQELPIQICRFLIESHFNIYIVSRQKSRKPTETKSNMNRSRIFFVLALTILAATTVCAQTYSVLDNFGGGKGDLKQPGALVQGPDGALYGTSTAGGAYGQGAFFTLTPTGQVQILYNFCNGPKCSAGAYPSAVTLMLRPDGHFLGFTALGGTLGGGTVFDVDDTGDMTVLYNFQHSQGISLPLIVGGDGQFYGISQSGGPFTCGGIISYVNGGSGNPIQSIYNFNGNGPCQPTALVVGTDGNFYGTTYFTASRGGVSCGAFFKLTLNGNFSVVHTFDLREGCTPASLTLGNDGNFYGTSTLNNGIFKITPAGNVTVLQTLNRNEGLFVVPGLVEGNDGNFYGAANAGGNAANWLCFGLGCGTLFQMTPSGNLTVIHDFDFNTGAWPATAPIQHTNGLFYGDAAGGSSWGQGGVFYSLNDNLAPFAALTPYAASVGTPVEILGQGFTSSSTVSFNGTPAISVQVSSATRLTATVPTGATTGLVTVTTSSGPLTSNQPFIVLQ
jgi:uncharacterized repeat protein (TIGR03803 family)